MDEFPDYAAGDVMRGDMRSLYLGWLLCAQDEAFDEEELEPPVPPGLGKLTPPLESLASFLGSEEDLLQTAAKLSSELPGDGRVTSIPTGTVDQRDAGEGKEHIVVGINREGHF
jgi:hypothetical protein